MAVRWCRRYGLSDRDVEHDVGQMVGVRGTSVDHSTIYRWVQRHEPEMEGRDDQNAARSRAR